MLEAFCVGSLALKLDSLWTHLEVRKKRGVGRHAVIHGHAIISCPTVGDDNGGDEDCMEPDTGATRPYLGSYEPQGGTSGIS
jgi:hypothetical protein